MAGRDPEPFIAGNTAEDLHLRDSGFHGLPQNPGVVFAPHVVEDHPGDRHVPVEPGETLDQGRGASRLALCVHNQDHLTREDFRDLRGTPCFRDTIDTVEEPHDPFDYGDIGVLCVLGKGFPNEFLRAHPSVQVDGGTVGYRTVPAGVDEVRAHLERGNDQPLPLQCLHETQCHGGLA